MTQEEKQLLLIDLCARLPYGVIVHNEEGHEGHLNSINQTIFGVELGVNITAIRRVDFQLDTCKPYLRPMSSMTKEEYVELRKMTITSPNLETAVTLFWEHHYDESPNWRNDWTYCALPKVLDWLNAHHFDYRGLIPMGLALEAKEGMYRTE